MTAWDTCHLTGTGGQMRCAKHGTDGCGECKPAVHAAWTVGQLKTVLAVIGNDTPLVVNAADFADPDVADEQVIVGAGFGMVDWGDGHGPEQDPVFGLNCERPEGLLRTKPDRTLRQAGERAAEPSPRGFRVETTTVDGRGQALLVCVACSRYGYEVSRRVGGRIGDLFGTQDLGALLAAAGRHECPAEVQAWAGR